MGVEKYHPSSKELKQAVDTMTDEQKASSEALMKRSNAAKMREGLAQAEKAPQDAVRVLQETGLGSSSQGIETVQPEKPYQAQEEVNGVDISVTYVPRENMYEIYFPGMDSLDQVLLISSKGNDAKRVFEYARELAEAGDDVKTVYKKVEAFVSEL